MADYSKREAEQEEERRQEIRESRQQWLAEHPRRAWLYRTFSRLLAYIRGPYWMPDE